MLFGEELLVSHPIDSQQLCCLTGVQFTTQGLIGVTDGSFTTVPNTFASNGLLLRLWNAWAKGDLLTEISVVSPTFNSDSRGWMLARTSIPNLDVLVKRESTKLGVMLVNRSLTESARVSLIIDNYAPTQISAKILTGKAPDSSPGLTIPDIVNPISPANLDRFSQGAFGEVWIKEESQVLAGAIPNLRIPPSTTVFLTFQE